MDRYQDALVFEDLDAPVIQEQLLTIVDVFKRLYRYKHVVSHIECGIHNDHFPDQGAILCVPSVRSYFTSLS